MDVEVERNVSTSKQNINIIDKFITEDDLFGDEFQEEEKVKKVKKVKKENNNKKAKSIVAFKGDYVFILEQTSDVNKVLAIIPSDFFIHVENDTLSFKYLLRDNYRVLCTYKLKNHSSDDFRIYMSIDTFKNLLLKDLTSLAIMKSNKLIVNNRTIIKIKRYVRVR